VLWRIHRANFSKPGEKFAAFAPAGARFIGEEVTDFIGADWKHVFRAAARVFRIQKKRGKDA
jgi:hypothetical protein